MLFCACQKFDKRNDELVPLCLYASNETSRRIPNSDSLMKIGLFVCEENTEKPYGGNTEYMGVKATLKNGTWQTDIPLYVGDAPATIYAYCPDTLDISNPREMPVNSRTMDLLYGKCTGINNQNPEAILSMQHLFARLKLRMYYLGFDEGYRVATFVAIGNVNQAKSFSTSGSLNIYSGTLTSTPNINAKSFLPAGDTYTLPDVPTAEEYMEMLVIPAKFGENEMKITVRLKSPATKSFILNAGEWLPGTTNRYTLMIRP